MITTRWISLLGAAALGLVAIQARAENTSKGERFGVGPIYATHQATGGEHMKCQHCRRELTAVRVPLDSKERSFGTRYVQEHRCPGCKFRVRVTKAGSKETRTVMLCSPACAH
ncbi:MAG TPA: hypothetical protein PLU30_25595 [Verrucomicrobiae bacterium]|nr:hypothetical protein [Verrucomicrobiae bacterium]